MLLFVGYSFPREGVKRGTGSAWLPLISVMFSYGQNARYTCSIAFLNKPVLEILLVVVRISCICVRVRALKMHLSCSAQHLFSWTLYEWGIKCSQNCIIFVGWKRCVWSKFCRVVSMVFSEQMILVHANMLNLIPSLSDPILDFV